ncbi:MAG: class I SAM-dependent methyltransferase [Gammaproteobacteria bacterium]|nr:class I SAM-dependent methyltransferase [Gammaproteobacteria bacterium]
MTEFKPENIAVLCLDDVSEAKARSLAYALSLPIYFEPDRDVSRYLVVTRDYVALRSLAVGTVTDLVVDFVGGKVGFRYRKGEGKNQPLAKAVGVKSGFNPVVLDLTAGLGRDAFFLAGIGCPVTLIERSPYIFTALDDGLNRAMASEEIMPVISAMTWKNAQALAYLEDLKENMPDVIYLDPMYPHRDKSALVKKEMRIIRDFVGDDDDTAEVVNEARKRAKKRVVVKRPKTANPVIKERANFTVESKNTRYDVYLPVA